LSIIPKILGHYFVLDDRLRVLQAEIEVLQMKLYLEEQKTQEMKRLLQEERKKRTKIQDACKTLLPHLKQLENILDEKLVSILKMLENENKMEKPIIPPSPSIDSLSGHLAEDEAEISKDANINNTNITRPKTTSFDGDDMTQQIATREITRSSSMGRMGTIR
jgi:chromosome segregation ATPase